MAFKVRLLRQPRSFLKRAPRGLQSRLRAAIDELREDPIRACDGRLAGTAGGYKKRVGGYRILVEVDLDAHVVVVRRIGDRGGVYRS